MDSSNIENFIYEMPVINGGIDNRRMMNIDCDDCGLPINKIEMIVCSPCGNNDFHEECANKRFKDKTELENMRKITYEERMEEYMYQRFNNGQAQNDLNNLLSALNSSFPDHSVSNDK